MVNSLAEEVYYNLLICVYWIFIDPLIFGSGKTLFMLSPYERQGEYASFSVGLCILGFAIFVFAGLLTKYVRTEAVLCVLHRLVLYFAFTVILSRGANYPPYIHVLLYLILLVSALSVVCHFRTKSGSFYHTRAFDSHGDYSNCGHLVALFFVAIPSHLVRDVIRMSQEVGEEEWEYMDKEHEAKWVLRLPAPLLMIMGSIRSPGAGLLVMILAYLLSVADIPSAILANHEAREEQRIAEEKAREEREESERKKAAEEEVERVRKMREFRDKRMRQYTPWELSLLEGERREPVVMLRRFQEERSRGAQQEYEQWVGANLHPRQLQWRLHGYEYGKCTAFVTPNHRVAQGEGACGRRWGAYDTAGYDAWRGL